MASNEETDDVVVDWELILTGVLDEISGTVGPFEIFLRFPIGKSETL